MLISWIFVWICSISSFVWIPFLSCVGHFGFHFILSSYILLFVSALLSFILSILSFCTWEIILSVTFPTCFFHLHCYHLRKFQCFTSNFIHLVESQTCLGWAGGPRLHPVSASSHFSLSLILSFMLMPTNLPWFIALPLALRPLSRRKDVCPSGISSRGSWFFIAIPRTYFWCLQFWECPCRIPETCWVWSPSWPLDLGAGTGQWSSLESKCGLLAAASDASESLASLITSPSRGVCSSVH